LRRHDKAEEARAELGADLADHARLNGQAPHFEDGVFLGRQVSQGRPKRLCPKWEKGSMNIRTLVVSALQIIDPVACLQIQFDDDVEGLTAMITSLQATDPEMARALDPQTLARMVELADDTKQDLADVLRNQLAVAA
jgi:hypothetical protein